MHRPQVAVVIGASGGIGGAVMRSLDARGGYDRVIGLSRTGAEYAIDIEDEASIAAAASYAESIGEVRLVFVATGLLHDGAMLPEKSWRQLDPDSLARLFLVNAIGPALVGKHFLPLLPRSGRAVFAALSARVGSISDNRLGGWYGYRASKAALNQMIRSLAIELGRTRPEALCVALHPGTVDSDLSKPFRKAASERQSFTPAESADYLLDLLDALTPGDSGGLFAWDGQAIAF